MGDLAEERAHRVRADGPHQVRALTNRDLQIIRDSSLSTPGRHCPVRPVEYRHRCVRARGRPRSDDEIAAFTRGRTPHNLLAPCESSANSRNCAHQVRGWAIDRRAPLLLGAMMLLAAVSITTLSTEATSTAFIVAYLTIGPGGVLGALLSRGREGQQHERSTKSRRDTKRMFGFSSHGAMTGCVLALLMVTSNANAQERHGL